MAASTNSTALTHLNPNPLDPQLAALEDSKFPLDTGKDGWQTILASTWSKIYPESTTPAFLIDLGPRYASVSTADPKAIQALEWKVISVTDLPKNDIEGATVLFDQGWSALSYAWGEYMPEKDSRQVYLQDRIDCQLPLAVGDSYAKTKRFSKNTVPKNDFDWLVPHCPAIEVPMVKKILLDMGKRFAWWDVACIPQKDCSEGYAPSKAKPLPGYLQTIANAEVNKQRFVYEFATVGASWVHSQCFHALASELKEVLSKTSYYFDPLNTADFFATRIAGPAANERRLKTIQVALSMPLFGYQGTLPTEVDKRNPILDKLRHRITTLKDLFLEIRAGDGYFRSLWSFQEVRLLRQQFFVDTHGDRYDLCVDKKTANASFLHLAFIAAFLTSQLSLAIAASKSPAIGKRVTAEVNPYLLALCDRDPIDRQKMEEALRQLKGCGMGFAPQETPLQVLAAARRSRFPSLNKQDNYQAMRGVLALDGDFSMTCKYEAPLPEQQKEFFRVLVKKYQWKALQLAKATKDAISGWSAVSLGHFEPVAAYFEGFITNKFATATTPTYTLPTLTYEGTSDEIFMKPSGDSKSFRAWRLPADLTQVDNLIFMLDDNIKWFDIEEDPLTWPTKSRIAEAQKVLSMRLAQWPAQSQVRLLIPLMPLNEAWSELGTVDAPTTSMASARCLMIQDVKEVAPGMYSAVFGAIMDIKGLKIDEIAVNEIRLKWQ